MKKITEKQLMEAARALRDYTDMMEANPVSSGVKAAGNAVANAIPNMTKRQQLGAGVTTAAAAGNAILNPGQIPQSQSSSEADDLALGQQNLKAMQQVQAAQQPAPAAPQSAAPAPASTDRDWSWENAGKAIGNVWQGVKNTANAVTGAASDIATGFNSAQTPATSAAKPTAPTNKWPTTPQEITAFQKANGLKADGLIGPNTMQALAKQGIQPPAGFQMAGPKKAAPAKPAKPTDPMAQSPEEAEDERIAQNQAFYNMSPEQQAMYNKGVAQQGQKPAAAPANAQTPATAPNAAAAAITPNFASQQAPAQTPAATPEATPTPKQKNQVITYNESAYPEMTRFKNLISVEEMFENVTEAQHVSFKQDDSLARIIQLSKKEIK